MLYAIASALLPILFVVFLGWLAARTKIIPSSAAGTLAAFVVNFALPLSLFLAAADAKTSDLANWRYVLALVVGIAGTFIVGFVLSKLVFKHDLRAAAIQAQSCSFPNMAYCGPPVLGAVIGPAGILAVLIGNLVTSLITLPTTLVLLRAGEGGSGDGAGRKSPRPGLATLVGTSLLGAAKAPLVWLPVAGIVLALLGVKLPQLVTSMTNEIGSASGGVALFTLGLMLESLVVKLDREVVINVAVKNLLQPALLLGAAFVLGLHGPLGKEVFLIGVLPSGTIVPSLAHSNKAYETQASLTAMASTLFSIITITAGIVIAKALP